MQTYKNRLKKSPPTESLLGRSLPSSRDAEKAVLGAILLNDEHMSLISELLKPSDFYQPAHQLIFEQMLKLFNELKRIDIVTLKDALIKKDTLEAIGDVMYLISLQEDIPAICLIEQHGQIIKEKAVLRELISSAATLMSN